MTVVRNCTSNDSLTACDLIRRERRGGERKGREEGEREGEEEERRRRGGVGCGKEQQKGSIPEGSVYRKRCSYSCSA